MDPRKKLEKSQTFDNNTSYGFGSQVEKAIDKTKEETDFVEAVVYVRPHALECLNECREMGF